MSAALLAFLVTKIPSGSIEPKDTHAGTLLFLAAALGLTFAGFVLSAWRWQRVLAVFDVHIPLSTLLGYYLAGQFVGNVLPSTIGGDVLRISRASKTTGGDIAFASVAIERLTGFVALPLLTLLGIAIKPSLLDVPHTWIAILISLVTVAALLVILVVAGSPHLAGRFAKHENWMRFIGAVHIGVARHAPRAAPRHQRARRGDGLPAVGRRRGVVRGARARRVGSRRARCSPSFPRSRWHRCCPISLSGLGIREGLLVLLLHPLGVPTGKAIGVGLLWYGMTLIVSLLGAPLFAVGHRDGKPRPTTRRASPPTLRSRRPTVRP